MVQFQSISLYHDGEGMAGCMVTGVRSEGSSQGMDQDAEIGDRTRDAENP